MWQYIFLFWFVYGLPEDRKKKGRSLSVSVVGIELDQNHKDDKPELLDRIKKEGPMD